jgi:excisionase family DNA binding protein
MTVETSPHPLWALPADAFWFQLRALVAEELESIAVRQRALLTLEETAELCRCSTRHIRRLRRDGLPVLFLGDSPRFEREAVLSWLRERSAIQGPGTEAPGGVSTENL